MNLKYMDYETKKMELIVCQQVVFKTDKNYVLCFLNENDPIDYAKKVLKNDIVSITD